MRFLIVAALVGLACAAPDETFKNFQQKFGKAYRNKGEEMKRRAIFDKNYDDMIAHNKRYDAGEVGWWKKIHEDMDLTGEEFMALRVEGLPHYDENSKFVNTYDERIKAKLAEPRKQLRDFSWADSGMVSSVKNQGQCGSCAAFAAIGAIESCSGISMGSLDDDLSEQHILDCAYEHTYVDSEGSWGAYGCDGAWPQAYLDWLIINSEANQEESSYPYTSGSTGDVTSCSPSSNGYSDVSVSGMWNEWFTTENDAEGLLAMNPVITAVQVTNSWSGYGGGILDAPDCCEAASDSSCVYNLNHAVLMVGYGPDYWLVKNSWGTGWGESGFFKIKRGTGHCGVASLHQTIPYCG